MCPGFECPAVDFDVSLGVVADSVVPGLVGFEPESVRFRILVLLNLLRVTRVT